MFSMLIVGYLFFGGTGGGALVVLSLLECANVRRRYGWEPISPKRIERALALPNDLFAYGWLICLVILTAGILCLMADIGRPDRLLNLAMTPTVSVMTVGAYALVIALICAAAFFFIEIFDGFSVSRSLIWSLSIVGFIAGIITTLYTGVLLQSLVSVLFWQTPLLPVLFFVSALSCGIACVLFVAVFVGTRWSFMHHIVYLARADSIFIIAEVACLIFYLMQAQNGNGTRFAAQALLTGDLFLPFWVGVILCGLGIPFILEHFVAYGDGKIQLLWIAGFLLVGGFILRWCVVQTGMYDITQMSDALFGMTL